MQLTVTSGARTRRKKAGVSVRFPALSRQLSILREES